MNADGVITIIKTHQETLPGLHDILIRGSLCSDELLNPGWSDIDSSFIFNEIKPETLLAVNRLKQEVKKSFPYKFTTTVLTRRDFENQINHHGIKPLHYSHSLRPFISLLGKSYSQEAKLPKAIYKLDVSANIAYLIHDLRIQFTNLNLEDIQAIKQFYMHAARRSVHLINNIRYCLENTSWDPNRLDQMDESLKRHQKPKPWPDDVTLMKECEQILFHCENAHQYYTNYVDEIITVVGPHHENNNPA